MRRWSDQEERRDGGMPIRTRQKRLVCALALAMLSACGAGSDSGDTPSSLRLQSRTETCTSSSVPMTRYFGDRFSAHTAYMDRRAYLDDGSFVFVANPGGAANLFVFRANGSPAITRYADKRLEADAETFGMTPLTRGNSVFFAAEGKVFRADAPNFVSSEVARVPDRNEIHAPLSISDDLQWAGARVQEGAVSRVCRISTGGAGQDCLDSPFLGTEQPLADHVQIHPHRPELLMFAHDGSWVRDRVWRWTVGDLAAFPHYMQPEFVEMGHESWCHDGAAICLVQYGSPSREIPSALNVIDLNGQLVEQYLFDGIYASHASGSPDGRYWVLDTYRPDANGELWIYVLDTLEGLIHSVCPVRMGNHPAHAHPSWSADGSRFLYNDIDTNGSITIVEVKLADVLQFSSIRFPVETLKAAVR